MTRSTLGAQQALKHRSASKELRHEYVRRMTPYKLYSASLSPRSYCSCCLHLSRCYSCCCYTGGAEAKSKRLLTSPRFVHCHVSHAVRPRVSWPDGVNCSSADEVHDNDQNQRVTAKLSSSPLAVAVSRNKSPLPRRGWGPTIVLALACSWVGSAARVIM